MSLSCEDKSINAFFIERNPSFLIPDYQRPYAWGEDECGTLWDDIVEFAIPEGNKDNFKEEDQYFLGPIVVFKNGIYKEIIDGQQRITTLLLLLRSLYVKLKNMKDAENSDTWRTIEKCIWKLDSSGNVNKEQIRVKSDVATDEQYEEFQRILSTGIVDNCMKSQYAKNYLFFQNRIEEFVSSYASYIQPLAHRLIYDCYLLTIEAGNQDAALRIFSTLNDRGLPLSDSDIFKAQLYKFYSGIGKIDKDDFIKRWKILEEKTKKYFKTSGNSMDELFARYMYFIRAKNNIRKSTTEGLRKFYEDNSYSILKSEETLNNLEDLVSFWEKVATQDEEYFSYDVLRNLFVLNYAPNSMWYYFVSVYFLQNRNEDKKLDNDKFNQFLNKCIAFIWGFTVVRAVGVNMLRTPIYAEMINIVNNKPVTFSENLFVRGGDQDIQSAFERFEFTNNRPITKAMLAWWAMRNQSQEKIPSLDTKFDIEHIFAKNSSISLSKEENLEAIGNKSLLEPKINHKVTNFEFSKKKPYYKGEKRNCDKTVIVDLIDLAKKDDFLENDIEERTKRIIDSFIDYIVDNDLLK